MIPLQQPITLEPLVGAPAQFVFQFPPPLSMMVCSQKRGERDDDEEPYE